MPASRGGARATLLATGAFLAVGTWLAGRALFTPGLLVGGGDQPDYTGTVSYMWWTGFALRHGLDPSTTTWSFFPVGQQHVAQYNLLDALLGSPLLALLGPDQGYDAFVVLVLASTGLGGFVLGRTAGLGAPAAAFVGLAVECSANLTNEVQEGRTSQALLLFWLLALAGLLRLFRGEGGPLLAVVAGLCVAAAGLVYWYAALALALAALPLALATARRWDRATLGRLLVAGGVALAVVGPFVWALARDYATLPGVGRTDMADDYGLFSHGEFGLAMAIRHSNWVGWPVLRRDLLVGIVNDQRVACTLLALAAGALAWRLPGCLCWAGVALLGYLLALGPWPRLADGSILQIPLPYQLLYEFVPFFQRFWWPARLGLLFVVGMAVLAGLLLDTWHRRWPRGGAAAAVGCALLLVGEQAARVASVPLPAGAPPAVSTEVYQHLDGPVLTTPVLGLQAEERHLLWFQVFHEQPIFYGLGAHLRGHRPEGLEAYVDGNGLLRALAAITGGGWDGGTVTVADVEGLRADGFAWAVVDTAAYAPHLRGRYSMEFAAVFSRLWGEPRLEGGTARAWRIAAIEGPEDIPAAHVAPPRRRARRAP